MLRDQALVPLSRQHHLTLALCVQIDRAIAQPSPDLAALQQQIVAAFSDHIAGHFEAEEALLFPTLEMHDMLRPLVQELLTEHANLRTYLRQAVERRMRSGDLKEFAAAFTAHIRKEERQLFEVAQQVLLPQQLKELGEELAGFFQSRGIPGLSCDVPIAGEPLES